MNLVTPTFCKKYFGEPGTLPFIDEEMVGAKCKCGHPNCTESGEMAIWTNGREVFSGFVGMPTGQYKKLDNPEFYGTDDPYADAGHLMTLWEYSSEVEHLNKERGGGFLEFVNARSIGKYLVNFRFVYKLLEQHGITSENELIHRTQQDEIIYPFYEEGLVFKPYTRNPPPKVRAGDIVEVILCKELVYDEKLVIKNDDSMEIYVISLTSSGIVTGFFQTSSSERFWVYFPIHHARRVVKRGSNWGIDELVSRLDIGEDEHIEYPNLDREYFGDLGSEVLCIPLSPMTTQCCHNASCQCSNTSVAAQWRPQGQSPFTFLGSLQVHSADGMKYRKLDSPIDFLRGGANDKIDAGENLDTFLPGHWMNYWEWMSEMNHCTDSDGSFLKEMKARDICKYLVDYRSHQKKRGVEMNDDMYPFYQQLKPPYTDAPSPKVRAGDVIEVTLKENIPIFGFRMKGSLSLFVYVVSLTSAGVVTGIVQTNKNKYWVYFPVHHAKKLLTRGENWNR